MSTAHCATAKHTERDGRSHLVTHHVTSCQTYHNNRPGLLDAARDCAATALYSGLHSIAQYSIRHLQLHKQLAILFSCCRAWMQMQSNAPYQNYLQPAAWVTCIHCPCTQNPHLEPQSSKQLLLRVTIFMYLLCHAWSYLEPQPPEQDGLASDCLHHLHVALRSRVARLRTCPLRNPVVRQPRVHVRVEPRVVSRGEPRRGA